MAYGKRPGAPDASIYADVGTGKIFMRAINSNVEVFIMSELLKVEPPSGYPPEDGRYLKGNDYSPVAVVALLNTFDDQVPEYLESIVSGAVEAGAAISGLLQTENIGLEKIIFNIIANRNIRYLVLCGPESPGHHTGEALAALMENGVDKKRRIIGTDAPSAYLFNTPIRYIARFRTQITLVDLLNETDLGTIKEAVRACYQEVPTKFREYTLFDPGAYDGFPICEKMSARITQPWTYAEPEEKAIFENIMKKAADRK